jgi:hypothetical protein
MDANSQPPGENEALERLLYLALESKDPVGIRSALEANKFVHEARKLGIEAAKLEEETKVVRQQFNIDRWVKIAQTVTPLGLLLTIMVQAFQIWSTQRAQVENQENTAWMDGLKTYMSANSSSAAAAETFFQSHLQSKKYGPLARQILLEELPHTSSTSQFAALFHVLFDADSPEQLNEIIAVDRELFIVEQVARDKGDSQTRYLATDNVTFVTDQLGARLRDRKSGEPLDLRWTYFDSGEFLNANMTGAKLDGAYFYRVKLGGAQLCQASADDLSVDNTAWWQAKEIEPALLSLLIKKTEAATDAGGNTASPQTAPTANPPKLPAGAVPVSPSKPVSTFFFSAEMLSEFITAQAAGLSLGNACHSAN